MGFPVLRGAQTFCVAEGLRKIAGGGETQNTGDLGQGKIGFHKKTLALPDAAGDQIADGRYPVFLLEGVGHIVLIDADFFGKQIQSEVFFVMLFDILAHRGALAIFREAGRGLGDGYTGVSNELNHNDIHVGQAHRQVLRLLPLHFLQDIAHTGQNGVAFRKGVNTVSGFVGIGVGQLQSLHTQNDILHGLGGVADLRVQNVRVHYNKLMGLYRKGSSVDLELARSANNVKQFGIVMGMRNGVPISTVFRRGHITQRNMLPGSTVPGQMKRIVCMAHGNRSFTRILL